MDKANDSMNETMNVAQTLISQLNEWIATFVDGLPELLAAIVVFGIFWYASIFIKKVVVNLLTRFHAPRPVRNLFGSVTRIAVIAIGLMVALGIMNLDKTVTSMLAGLGIVGVALGFAFQDIAANFISGLLLIFRKPFEIGHIIQVNDITGVVERIDIRTTIIRTFQGQLVHVPNSQVFQNAITNFSEKGDRRIDLALGVGYDTNLDAVESLLFKTISDLDFIKNDPQPMVHFEEFGGSAINLVMRFWIDFSVQPDFLTARSESVKAIKKVCDENNINIPFDVVAIDLAQQNAEKNFK